jgi:hypothetical protein
MRRSSVRFRQAAPPLTSANVGQKRQPPAVRGAGRGANPVILRAMTRGKPTAKRPRGEIEPLLSGSLRVKVYAGIDPVSKTRMYLRETVPAGPKAEREAEKVLTRFLNEVYERRNPRTDATVVSMFEVGCADVRTRLQGVAP